MFVYSVMDILRMIVLALFCVFALVFLLMLGVSLLFDRFKVNKKPKPPSRYR